MNTSLTIKGVMVTFLSWGFLQLGVSLGTEEVEIFFQVIAGIVFAIGQAITFYGRWRHGDISIFGSKKD